MRYELFQKYFNHLKNIRWLYTVSNTLLLLLVLFLVPQTCRRTPTYVVPTPHSQTEVSLTGRDWRMYGNLALYSIMPLVNYHWFNARMQRNMLLKNPLIDSSLVKDFNYIYIETNNIARSFTPDSIEYYPGRVVAVGTLSETIRRVKKTMRAEMEVQYRLIRRTLKNPFGIVVYRVVFKIRKDTP